MATSKETITGIESRRQAYVKLVREPLLGKKNIIDAAPFAAALTPDKRELILRQIDSIKTETNLTTIVRTIYEVITAALPAGEAEAQVALERVRSAIFPRLAELVEWNDQLTIIGVLPTESHFANEEQLQAELEILLFIYGQATPQEVRDFLTQKKTAERAQADAQQQAQLLEAQQAVEKAERDPKNLPNDFFRFLYDNNVPWEEVSFARHDGEGDVEYRTRLQTNADKLCNKYFSLLLDRAQNDIREVYLTLPDLADGKGLIRQFAGKSAHKEYSGRDLAADVIVGMSGIAREVAQIIASRFEGIFNTIGAITAAAEKFKTVDSPDDLQRAYFPLGNKGQEQADALSWYDFYFWSQLLGKEVEDPNTHVKEWKDGPWKSIQYSRYNDQTKEWETADRNLRDQFLTAMSSVFDNGRFPGINDLRFSVPVPLDGQRKQLRPAATIPVYIKQGGGLKREYQPKIVRQTVYGPNRIYPLRTDMTGERPKRIEAMRKISIKAAGGEQQSKDFPNVGPYVTYLAANMLESWLEGMEQDSELKLAKGAEWIVILGLDRTRIPAQLLDVEGKLKSPYNSGDPYIEAAVQAAFTVRDQRINPKTELGFEGFDPGYVIEGLTRIEAATLRHQLLPNVLGVRGIDKSMHFTSYGLKAVGTSGEEGQESQFQTRAIGLAKTDYLTFGDYFFDYETGKTLTELIQLAAQGDESAMKRIPKMIGTAATQIYGGHVKDATTLTNIKLKGFDGGSLLNIAEFDIKTGESSKLNEKYIGAIRAWYRTLYAYQYERDMRPADRGFEGKFMRDEPMSQEVLDGIAKHFIVVQVKDQSGNVGRRLLRVQKSWNLIPQDIGRFVDPEAVVANRPAEWSPAPFRGVRTIEVNITDPKKTLGGKELATKTPTPAEVKTYLEGYVDTLLMRDQVAKYFFMASGSDVIGLLKKKDKMFFGMIFSAEMREKFEKGTYTRGPIGNIEREVVKAIAGKFFDPEFFDVEVPDMAGKNLFSERGFYEMLIYMGYVNSFDDAKKEFTASADEFSKVFGGGK